MKPFAAFALCFCCSLLFSQAVYSQDFSSLDKDLELLENLINDTLNNTEEQQKLLEDLKLNLTESGNIIANYESTITEQENLLKDLQTRLNEMSETFKMQSALSQKYEKSSKFWRTFTLIAIPVTAVISGGIVLAVSRQ
jgi:Zn-dependent M16 (insulinase) family peptidase